MADSEDALISDARAIVKKWLTRRVKNFLAYNAKPSDVIHEITADRMAEEFCTLLSYLSVQDQEKLLADEKDILANMGKTQTSIADDSRRLVRLTRWLIGLTVALGFFTVALLVFTVLLWHKG